MSGLPVILNLDERPAVIIGGGSAGTRKIAAMRAAGASVKVVDPADLDSVAWADDEQVSHIKRRWAPGDGDDAIIVVIATDDPAVNEAAAQDAHRAGALVLRSDGGPDGDVRLPAVHRTGRVTVAVDTDGASPTLAAHLRDDLVGHTIHWAELAEWAAVNRPVTDQAIDQRHAELRSATNAKKASS